MSILFEVGFTSGYVHICPQEKDATCSPSHFPSSRFRLFFAHPFSLYSTFDYSAQHDSKSNSGPLGTELLIGEGPSNQCWCHWVTPNHVRPAWHYTVAVNRLIETRIPQGKCYTSRVSLELGSLLVLHPDKFLVLSLFPRWVCYTMSCFLSRLLSFFISSFLCSSVNSINSSVPIPTFKY